MNNQPLIKKSILVLLTLVTLLLLVTPVMAQENPRAVGTNVSASSPQLGPTDPAEAALAFVWFLNYWNLVGWRF